MTRIMAFAIALSVSIAARAQDLGEVQRSATIRSALLAVPLGVGRESKSAVRDFATFRDPQWSALTIAQIGAATADAVTSVNNLKSCLGCTESGVARFIVGKRPDAHKYAVAGIAEVSLEALAARYLRNHGPTKKWYWRMIWALPQSLSLYEHAHASYHNATLRW